MVGAEDVEHDLALRVGETVLFCIQKGYILDASDILRQEGVKEMD